MWLLDALYNYRDSNKTAVIHNGEKTSFGELWKESEAVAGFLESHHLVDNKTPVVIYGNKETDIIAVMHGALKSGLAYVPVDTSYPLERLEKIMGQVGAEVLFNFSDIEVTREGCQVVDADQLHQIYEEYKDFQSNSQGWVADDDICYILFTSGSTGEPKGVPIRKRNIVNFVEWVRKFVIDQSDSCKIVMNQIAYSFDLSVTILYVYLSEGYTLYSIDKADLSNLSVLFKILRNSHLSAWVSTPSLTEICCFDNVFNRQLLPNLRTFFFVGETLTKRVAAELLKRFPSTHVINGYGPTECTVAISACEITEDMIRQEDSLPVGKLIDDARISLLNVTEQNQSTVGELAVVSKSTGNGYFNNEEKTRKSFWLDNDSGLHGYKTGDFVYIKNGLLYFIGRMDSQIKLNGFRIELDDIAENLNKLNYISNSIVIPAKEDNIVKYLVAFIKLSQKTELSNLKLLIKVKKDLGNLIPEYMVPKKIIVIDEFPLNVNGKIDRKKLMERL